ncbi:hypothetical protein PTKIN_Ptkin10aG0130900 [Pterospermum kingtungense]
MSEEGGHESFLLFENQSRGLSNPDNNSADGSDEKSGKKHLQEEEAALHDDDDDDADDETKKINKRGRGRGGGVARNGKLGSSNGKVRESEHEMHIWTERERRKKMRNMFANLHALLPQLSPKADKSTIVDEAVNHIKTLQQTLQKLQKQKLERLQDGAINFGCDQPSLMMTSAQNQALDSRESFLADRVSSKFLNPLSGSYQCPVLFQTWTSSNVVLNICGNEAQISVCSPKKPGLFAVICNILEKHKLEVVSAHVSSSSTQSMFMIQAHASGASNNQLSEAVQVEEMFKQAAAEMMFWVSAS